MPMPPSTGRADSGDESRGVGGQEHNGVSHVVHFTEAAERGEADDVSDCCFGAGPETELLHVRRESETHLRGDKTRVDAVDADSVAELARLGGGNSGEAIDRGLGRGVSTDPGKRNGCGH